MPSVVPAAASVVCREAGAHPHPAIRGRAAAYREGARASVARTSAHGAGELAYFPPHPAGEGRALETPHHPHGRISPRCRRPTPPLRRAIARSRPRSARVLSSPGPSSTRMRRRRFLAVPDGPRRQQASAGRRGPELVLDHWAPLGFMLDSAARTLGCVVVPAGTGQTDLQVIIAATNFAPPDISISARPASSLYRCSAPRARSSARRCGQNGVRDRDMLPESLRAEVELLQGAPPAGLRTCQTRPSRLRCPEKGGNDTCIRSASSKCCSGYRRSVGAGQSPVRSAPRIFARPIRFSAFATGYIGANGGPGRCACASPAPNLLTLGRFATRE